MSPQGRLLGNKVSFLSSEEILTRALTAREFLQRFIQDDNPYLDVLKMLERMKDRGLLKLEIVEKDELPTEFAVTIPSRRAMKVRDDTYTSAYKKEHRGRFTIAHELGHFFLHAQTVPQYALSQATSHHPVEEDVEWQANEFARWFLVTPDDHALVKNPLMISKNFGVDMKCATFMHERIKWYRHKYNR